ncbi:hypothetical protein POM88_029888 [Heracleum sosnowskyi]|uniref:Mitochondrial glycoprotein n=1 Tax=Heracleum sosnowskyi TaxID=360622 RepID=A0AAD8MF89_9APIA|nr:hypothetical protein POM88_029888 [Heracleum sosnowskyi]
MALSTILRRSASRFIGGGNRFCGNLILPSASVPAFRQFCSSPSLSSKEKSESLDHKRPSLDESLVNDLISQFQSLQRDNELLRNSYTKPLSAVKDHESVVKDEGIDESDKGIDQDSSLKGITIESSKDEGGGCETDKSDDDSKDEGKDSESHDSDDSSDDSKKSSSDSDDKSNNESLFETDENNEHSDHGSFCETLPERDNNSETGDRLPEPDDESLPKIKEHEELLKGIESEILRAKTFLELSTPIRHDSYVDSSIIMAREYQGEFIEVTVEDPTVFTNRQCNDYNEKKSSSFSMDLNVIVSCSRSGSIKVELKCGARPEGISVYSAKDSADDGTDSKVHMNELCENLKEEFGKYLEARGITLKTTNFIYGYMLHKANKGRLRILEKIRKMMA